MRRREFLAVAALTGTATALSLERPAVAASTSDTDTARAVGSYAAMQKYFYVPSARLYREQYPYTSGNPYSFVWPLSQAFAATNYLAGLRGIGWRYRRDVADRIAGVERYYSSTGRAPNAAVTPSRPSPPGYDSYVDPPLGAGGDKYYDDNGWLGLDFLQHLLVSGDRHALERAREIFRLLVAGWDHDRSHPFPGGIFWTQGAWAPSRSVMENAAAAKIGVHLWWLTRDRSYLVWAERAYGWVDRYLLTRDGLYWDSVGLDGHVYPDYWSYNQGVMVGAGVLLHRATGRRRYRERAESVAATALRYYGAEDRLYQQPSYFNAILLRNLLLLGDRYRAPMRVYGDAVWARYRDPATGLFRFAPDAGAAVRLLDQAAMTQIYALLAPREPGWPLV